MSLFELMGKKKKTLNKFVPLFFPVHRRKGDIGEGGLRRRIRIIALGEIGK